MKSARFLALAVAIGLGIAWFAPAAEEGKDIKAAVLKLAAALEKNDKEAAKKLVDELKKHDLEDVMHLMKPPGKEKDAIDVVKEGIEAKLLTLSKKAGDVSANAASYEKMASVVAAIAEVAAVKCPVDSKKGDKDPKAWAEWVNDMKDGAKALGEAAKKKDAKAVTTAAKKINGACNNCHGVFRD
jgi:hypothetical protein